MLPGAERASAHAVAYIVKDLPQASRFLAFVRTCPADLTPWTRAF